MCCLHVAVISSGVGLEHVMCFSIYFFFSFSIFFFCIITLEKYNFLFFIFIFIKIDFFNIKRGRGDG
jgi:hypothetical protein